MSVTQPTTRDAIQLIQSWSADSTEFMGVDYMPDNVEDYTDSENVAWDVLGPIEGKTPLHQMDTKAKLAPWEKIDEYLQKTAYLKELGQLKESDFIRIAKLKDPARMQRANDELFVRRTRTLWVRLQTAKEDLRWKALNNALTNYQDPVSKIKLNIDYQLPAVTPASIDWDLFQTTNPFADIQTELAAFDGQGVNFVDIVIPRVVSTWLRRNEDFRELIQGSPLIGQLGRNKLNELFRDLAGLDGGVEIRSIRVNNSGYSSGGVYTRFVPDNRVFLLGGRNGAMPNAIVDKSERLGEYANTPAMVDGYENIRPGEYMETEDLTKRVDVKSFLFNAGCNGLPVIYHPAWVRRINPKVNV